MEELDIGTKRFTRRIVLDDKGAGGAYHEYKVIPVNGDQNTPFATISFQKGPVKENDINGIHHEDLLGIVLHRLECFQKGDFRCRENALAITKIEEALMWLNNRTNKRKKVGVDGTSVNHE